MMKRNAREGGIRSRLVAVTAAAALLVASVATGTAVAAEDVPEETQSQVAAQTLDAVRNDDVTSGDAVEGGAAADGTGATGDAAGSGDQADAAAQHGDGADAAGDVASNDASDGDASDGDGVGGEDADRQTAVGEDAVADDGDADGDSSDAATPNAVGNASAREISDHVVQGVNPRGTTINLFDYDGAEGGGKINNGHVFHFASGGQSSYTELNRTTVNQWTGNYGHGNLKPAPRFGIVQNQLGADGYPVLSAAIDGTSLNYLFNDEDVSGKTSYTGVNGLLQVDNDGYYYYNSQQNFAQFNTDSDSFTLYDTWGVTPVGNSPAGQFFPFNTGEQVFSEGAGGLVQNGQTSGNGGTINHFFGLTMSTRFVQQYGGHADQEKTKPVTYNFSGDDDVWVYIDGVLVGDLGGIHDQVSLQIDFSSGEVVIYTDGRVGNNQSDNKFDANTEVNGTDLANGQAVQNAITSGKDVYWEKTTLKRLFQDAGVKSADSWATDTLPDNTYHTLDFFYMERGASDSNMALRYNLVSIPDSGIVKIDQDGHAMAGVDFTLQQADASYNQVSDGKTVTGTTGANGELILTHPSVGDVDGTPYTLDELGDASRYWILTENNTPAGYRGVQSVHLYFAYEKEDKSKGTGPLLVDNKWNTGAYSAPHVTVQADATVHVTTTNQEYDLDQGGTLFAVVMKHIDDNNNGTFEEGETTWAPVSGDAFKGWTVHNSGDQQQNIIAAAQANPYIFTLGTNGSYETTIEDLPGDILTYRHMIQEYQNKTYDVAMAEAKYSVAYFYTAGDLSASAGSGHAVTSKNTWQINSEGGTDSQAFDRIFSVTLNVPNIKNELKLKKTDEAGTPLQNAKFTLYKDFTDADSNGLIDDGEATVVRNDLTTGADGMVDITTNGSILEYGTYMLAETTVPDNHTARPTPIQIVVDGSGVHVNAGSDKDNVSVETGLGTLVYSMKGFAAGDQIDATLHDVQAQPQETASYPVGSDDDWTNVEGADALHLHYVDDGDTELNYAGTNVVASTYTAEAGWSRLKVIQCRNHESDENRTVKQDLGDTDLSALFTGDVTIVVKNYPYPTVAPEIEKDLKGREWTDSDSFTFTLTADEKNPEGGVTLPDNAGALTIDNSTKDHKAKFGDITFSKAGAYTFTIAEAPNVVDDDTETSGVQHNGISYSQAEYQLTVEVTEDANTGKLTAEPTMTLVKNQNGSTTEQSATVETALFINTYVVSQLPLTGNDMTARNMLLTGVGVLLLAGGAWLLARRRRV